MHRSRKASSTLPGFSIGNKLLGASMKTLMSTVFVIAAATGMALAADKPDFSGSWKMDADKSVFGPMPPPTSMTRKVVHSDPALSVEQSQSGPQGDQNTTMKYSTDGKETTNSMMG